MMRVMHRIRIRFGSLPPQDLLPKPVTGPEGHLTGHPKGLAVSGLVLVPPRTDSLWLNRLPSGLGLVCGGRGKGLGIVR